MSERADEIAHSLLHRPETEWASFLDGACNGDEHLRAAAIAAVDRLRSQTETPASAPTLIASGGDSLIEGPGSMVGQYKLLQLIGEGGFGFVYMAQQSHPVKRKLALKIVKPGMDSKQVIGRFEAERQALAMMDHPNIARVYDAGTTPTGRPYFVMELVKGIPITEYCDDAKLSTNERIQLFIDVCHAVQHAHHKGIVHRDLKPSNVLVTLHDGKPVVKVIDFGIAKAMNQDLSEGTVFTEFRQIIGTPEYMSPEQAAMSGLDVDSRTDIFSLGVLLYELIAGATPLDSTKLRSAGVGEIQRIIREDEPQRPSTRVASMTAGASREAADPKSASHTKSRIEAVAKCRGTDPKSLRRLLVGDLDWICMKAMEKDRSRRYETSSALAADLERHLRHEPILARPPSALYQLRKFARRNRLAVGAAGGVLFALLLTLAALSYGLLAVAEERDKTAERETETRAQMLLSVMNAVRKYTADNVRPALAKLGSETHDATLPDYNAHFAKEMVPGFSARKVFTNFRDLAKAKGDEVADHFVYKEASPNPTNRDNLADEFEHDLVRSFTADPNTKELSGIRQMNGSRTYYIARPMLILDTKCLDCHTSPQTAPPRQVELYGRDDWSGGYGWKLNEVVAAQVVYVPVSEAFRAGTHSGVKVVLIIAAAAVLGGVGSLLLLLRKA